VIPIQRQEYPTPLISWQDAVNNALATELQVSQDSVIQCVAKVTHGKYSGSVNDQFLVLADDVIVYVVVLAGKFKWKTRPGYKGPDKFSCYCIKEVNAVTGYVISTCFTSKDWSTTFDQTEICFQRVSPEK